MFLLFFIGAFTGRLTDAGYFRVLFLTGSVLLTLGMFTTAVCTSYWQFLLAQGLCTGLGHGCLFCPTLAVLSTYFHKRRALALGIAACGSATGGLVFPSMVRQLLPQVGFAWTVRAIAFVQVAVLIVCNVVVKTRIRPRKAGPLLEPSAFKELEYTFYAAGAFFVRITTRCVLCFVPYCSIANLAELLGRLLCLFLPCRLFTRRSTPTTVIHGFAEPAVDSQRRRHCWSTDTELLCRPCRANQHFHSHVHHGIDTHVLLHCHQEPSWTVRLVGHLRHRRSRHPESVPCCIVKSHH